MSHNNPSKTEIGTEQGYDLWSDRYDARPSHTVRAARSALAQLLPELDGKSILEVGCGTGENLVRLSGKGVLNAIGLDFSEGMLAQARQKDYDFPTDFIRHDIQQGLPLPSESVDVVLMCLVLEHLSDIESMFGEIGRILRAGGNSLVIELHPYLALSGGFARFTSESDSLEYHMDSRAYSVSEILNAHLANQLIPVRALETTEDVLPSIFALRSLRT